MKTLLSSPVKIDMGVEGMIVEPAGVVKMSFNKQKSLARR